ncbi:MAG: bacteriohopanetetrol glucosamine biosynthesis glycosyltransferase HpnI [Steroidobacteraceae bacterium]
MLTVSLGIAAGYSLAALVAVFAWRRYAARAGEIPAVETPVTILKPLCGAEPALYEHLRSFCQQQHPQYQIVFGTVDEADPALAIVTRLIKEFPGVPIDTVISAKRHGHNNKTSNLINMLEKARYPVLLIADSDTWVRPDYLTTVSAPLAEQRVGLVTCLSYDSPTRGLWSRLGAMYSNDWYFPSVMLAWLFGHQGYASGQTLCLRRKTLVAIGGLNIMADHLADDHQLGHLIREQGLQIVLSPYEIQAAHHEPDFTALSRHELRWMGTLHVLRPRSFRIIFLTFSLILSSVGLLLTASASHPVAWALFAVTIAARCGLHMVPRLRFGPPFFGDLLLIPVRDLLTCGIWCRSFFCRRMTWRGYVFDVDSAGLMHRVA